MNVKVLEIEMSEAGTLAKQFSRSVPAHTSSNVVMAAGLLLSTYAAKRNGLPIEVFIALASKLWEETTDAPKPPSQNVPPSGEVH